MGTAHVCGLILRQGLPHICTNPMLEVQARDGYAMFMVPKYVVRYSNGEEAVCLNCGEPLWFAVFSTTEWN
jgi:hypothetical protein